MPSFFVLLQHNEEGEDVIVIAFFLFVCRATKKVMA